MNILEVNTEKSWRGGERQTIYNAEGLIYLKHDVTLLCLKGFPLSQHAKEKGIKVVEIKKRAGKAVLETYGSISLGSYADTDIGRVTNLPIEKIVEECVDRYFRVILYYKEQGYKTLAWGPIASFHPSRPYIGGPSFGTCKERNKATQLFNERLELRCDQYEVGFVTIFNKMVDSEGITILGYLDDWEGSHIHLTQAAMPLILEAFKEKNLI